MAWEKDDSPFIRWIRYSSESLKLIDNVELTTLKIHLVLENSLRFLLSKRLGLTDNALDDLRINFGTLLEIATFGLGADDLLGALRALNNARNSMSHEVESPKFRENLGKFLKEIARLRKRKHTWPVETTEELQRLREAFDDAATAIFDLAFAAEARAK